MKHQTLHKEIKIKVSVLRKHENVSKVVVGPYSNCRHRYKPGTILVKGKVNNGLKVFGYDGSGVHTLYVYVKPLGMADDVASYIRGKN